MDLPLSSSCCRSTISTSAERSQRRQENEWCRNEREHGSNRERAFMYLCSAVLDEGEPDRKNKRILSHIFFSDSSFFLRVDLMQSSGNKE
eukprot:scaffold18427_cov103-Skeletonema_marinoi.AAC.3